MAEIGQFRPEDGDSFRGYIRTLGLDLPDVRILPVESPTERHPTHRIWTDLDGRQVQIGSMWWAEGVQRYYSVQLDDPTWPEAINALLIIDPKRETASLVWSRRRRDDRPQSA